MSYVFVYDFYIGIYTTAIESSILYDQIKLNLENICDQIPIACLSENI